MNLDRDLMQIFSQRLQVPRWLERLYPYQRSLTYRLLRWSRFLINERLTPAGQVVAAAGMATSIPAAFPVMMTGDYMFWSLIALLLVALIWSGLTRPKVRVTRTMPTRAVAGMEIISDIAVENLGRRAIHDLRVMEMRPPPTLQLHTPEPLSMTRVKPGQRVSFRQRITPHKRGIYHLSGVVAAHAFPFGVTLAPSYHRQAHRFYVYPAFEPLLQMKLPATRSYQPGGIALASRVGESMEYISNREYRPGDRVRDLHPRSWARVGVPVVRQYQEEYLTRVALVADTHLSRWASNDRFEALLSLTAAVADYCARQDMVVDLFAAGEDLYHFQAGRSLAYLEDILDLLAGLEPCDAPPWANLQTSLSATLASTSAVVLLLLDWDAARAALVQKLRAQGVQTKVVVLASKRTRELNDPGVQVVSIAQVRAGLEAL